MNQSSPSPPMTANISAPVTFMAAPSSYRPPAAPQRLPRPMTRMINPSSLRQQPRARLATDHSDRECLFFSNVDHDLDICKACAATMSGNIRRFLPPFEAIGSFNQRNLSRPATAQRISSIFCDICGATVNDQHAPAVQTKISVAVALQATPLAGQPEAIAQACRHFPWPWELTRDGNCRQQVAMALTRAGMSPPSADHLAQLLINDEKGAVSD